MTDPTITAALRAVAHADTVIATYLDPSGDSVDLYHHTTEDNAASILGGGFRQTPGRGIGMDDQEPIWFSDRPGSTGYHGPARMKITVPRTLAETGRGRGTSVSDRERWYAFHEDELRGLPISRDN
jgi:hypothetical protein